MAIDTRISLYGIGIEHIPLKDQIKLYGVGIEHPNTKQVDLYGIGIEANTTFNGKIQINGFDRNPIQGATVTLTAGGPAGNQVGNLTGLTDVDGLFECSGSSTINTSIVIEKEGKASIKFSPIHLFGGNYGACLPDAGGGSSKKIYTTNKGNILINPNDTILIELD